MNKVLKEKDFKRKFPIKLVKHKSEWITSYEDEKINLLDILKQYKVTLYHNVEWELRWKEDNRAFLVKGYGEDGFQTKVYHLHIRKKGDIEEVKFRDVLIKNPKIAKQYERLKLDLELTYKYDREGYTAGKTKFIKDIIKRYSLHK